jgi:hypothetical protein
MEVRSRVTSLVTLPKRSCPPYAGTGNIVSYAAAIREQRQRGVVGFTQGRSARSGVAQLLIPLSRASLWRQVEQVPDRLEGANVAGILSGVPGRVEEL